MKFTKEEITLEEGLKREWIITNGIGGYASSTIIGANTRKYHGLLIAPLTPPARRFLILSKVDEAIEINGKDYPIYTNLGKNYISNGTEYQTEFRKDYIPIFSYEVEGIRITKMICMQYGKNTVGIYYKVKNVNTYAKFKIAPLMNFRDFHCMNTEHEFNLKQDINENKIKVSIDDIGSPYPIYIKASCGEYIKHDNDKYRNMFYIEEEKRGFYAEEDHAIPGIYEIALQPEEEKEIEFICSLNENIDEINVRELISKEIIRLNELINDSLLIDNRKSDKKEDIQEQNEVVKQLVQASDNFVVYRPSFGLHTLIAGYPWFLDWGRDSLIAFEGLLLITKRYDIAREVLLTYIHDIKFGLVPNGYSGYDNRPLYNSVDASLLLFEQIEKYVKYTGDYEFVRYNIYEKLKMVIKQYILGIDLDDNNIYLDADNLLVSGTENTQNTWMDAKYNNIAVTPRNGKAVEINAMWYNALMIMEDLSIKFGDKKDAIFYKKAAEECKATFQAKFYNEFTESLYDVIGDAKIRPNQIFALSLSYPVLDIDSYETSKIIKTIEEKLLNPYGLKSLAKGEIGYTEIYEGDGVKRDNSYHQGITWTWLLGPYYDTLKNIYFKTKNKATKKIYEEKIMNFRKNTYKTFKKEIKKRGCIGSIAEIYDSVEPYEPKGAFAQAWSVSEIFRIISGK